MGIRGRAKRGEKKERRFLFSSSSRTPCFLACSLPLLIPATQATVPWAVWCPGYTLRKHNWYSQLVKSGSWYVRKIGWLWPLLFQLLTCPMQIAALVWNHFRYENLHWESIGRRWLKPDLIPGSENKKIYRSRSWKNLSFACKSNPRVLSCSL